MSAIIVHGVPGSPYVRMPLIACVEKGVEWRLEPLGLTDTRGEAHLARHPFGRVPTIEHGDFTLYETQAILRYIDNAFEGPALMPQDPQAAARANQVMGVVDWYVMPSISRGICFNRVIRPMFGAPVNEDEVRAALPMARTCMAALEAILGDQPYFGGEALSLADISAGAHLSFMPMAEEGRELLEGSPLAAWLDRLNARRSFQTTTMQTLRAALEPQPA